MSFVDPVSEISVDIVTEYVGSFVPKEFFWENLEWVKVKDKKLPTASKIDLIILKAITFYMRKEKDPKKTGDVKDVKWLMTKYKISYSDVLKQAQKYNITSKVREFLNVVKRFPI